MLLKSAFEITIIYVFDSYLPVFFHSDVNPFQLVILFGHTRSTMFQGVNLENIRFRFNSHSTLLFTFSIIQTLYVYIVDNKSIILSNDISNEMYAVVS